MAKLYQQQQSPMLSLSVLVLCHLLVAWSHDSFVWAALAEDHESQSSSQRQLETSEGEGTYVYSKMATLPPDPLLLENTEQATEYEERFGRWSFWDGDEDLRPSDEDYMGKYAYRDMPGDEIDDDAWQADAVFVNHVSGS